MITARDVHKTHVPELERAAYNQMPKANALEVRLYRYEDGPVYQWWARTRDSVFWVPRDEPFALEGVDIPIDPPAGIMTAHPELKL